MAEAKKVIILVLVLLLLVNLPMPKGNELTIEAKKIAHACKTLENRETCYGKAFENLTEETNMEHAFAVLRELQKADPDARGCHFIAHSISYAETKKDPSKWREIMNSAPQDCSYGAAHGALEVYASTKPDGKLPKSEIGSVCDNPDPNNCTHILGHLLLVLNENDIPESLKDCQSLPHAEMGKFECLSGVFMERITAFNLENHGLATKEALNWPARMPELEALCREQTGTPSVACWKEIVHAALVKFRNDPQKIVDFCETAPRDEETRECIDHSLGIIASSYNFRLDKMKPICEAHVKAADFKERCYAGLVSSTLSTIPQELPAAERFCDSVESAYRKSCKQRIDNFINYNKNSKRSVTIN